MISQVFICVLLLKFGCGQLDGEFWWLSDKYASYAGAKPPSPKFENLSELDTDENSKLIFRDDNILETNIYGTSQTTKLNINNDQDRSDKDRKNIIKWPDEVDAFHTKGVINSDPEQSLSQESNAANLGDRFSFKFPEDDAFVWRDSSNVTEEAPTRPETETSSEKAYTSTSSTKLYNDNISLNIIHYEEKLSENICTYIKKSDCYQRKGLINNLKDMKKQKINNQLICCILPLKNKSDDTSSKVVFPNTMIKNVRLKRSEDTVDRQRSVLLQRRYAQQSHKAKPATQTKIATPDYEYDDPYWNIKNSKKPNKQKQESSTKHDYSGDDYIEDYVVELPRPGLTGLYSDNGKKPSGWTFSNQNKGSGYGSSNDYDDDDNISGFGYSTIDPRIGSDKTRKSRPRGKPLKLSSNSEEPTFDAESQIISYQSNPNFNVLHDFKLLNLMRNKVPKIARSTTTESFSDNDSKESLLDGPFDAYSDSTEDSEDQQIFEGCGNIAKPVVFKNKGKQIGDAENGSHPWLALLVSTRNLNSVLCYASLIHPRAAISAADCVHRSSSGDITLLTGLWNLNERTRVKSRVVSTFIHPKYKNGGLNNNLAILHWKRPLKLGVNVQPVCLANPHLDDECLFVGWGGFDQAIRPRSRWQRASVHTCKDRLSLNGVNVPNEAFCASVKSRGTVTGIGGSLVCDVNGHPSAVGVAISRDSTLVLLPVSDWVNEAIGVLLE